MMNGRVRRRASEASPGDAQAAVRLGAHGLCRDGTILRCSRPSCSSGRTRITTRGQFARAPGAVPQFPPTAQIRTADEARAYWQARFAGRALLLPVRLGEGEEREVTVFFRGDNPHGWTRAAREGKPPDVYDDPARSGAAQV